MQSITDGILIEKTFNKKPTNTIEKKNYLWLDLANNKKIIVYLSIKKLLPSLIPHKFENSSTVVNILFFLLNSPQYYYSRQLF